jgi:hypothetical protein
VASNQLDLVLTTAFLHHVCPFESLKRLGLCFLEHSADLFNFIDGGLDALVGVDKLESVHSLPKLHFIEVYNLLDQGTELELEGVVNEGIEFGAHEVSEKV